MTYYTTDKYNLDTLRVELPTLKQRLEAARREIEINQIIGESDYVKWLNRIEVAQSGDAKIKFWYCPCELFVADKYPYHTMD